MSVKWRGDTGGKGKKPGREFIFVLWNSNEGSGMGCQEGKNEERE